MGEESIMISPATIRTIMLNYQKYFFLNDAKEHGIRLVWNVNDQFVEVLKLAIQLTSQFAPNPLSILSYKKQQLTEDLRQIHQLK